MTIPSRADAEAPTLERAVSTAPSPDNGEGEPFEGPQLGRYKVLRQLGRGGMGVVYTAYDEALDRIIALKMLRPDRCDSVSLGRFLREAKALARLSHPNVVQVHDVHSIEGRIYLAMEYVQGRTLREAVAQLPRGAGYEPVVELYLQAGRGLLAVHQAGLIHRDLKPDNILVGDDGRVRVMDFGLVRSAQGEDTSPDEGPIPSALEADLTAFGAILGTPAYMAPEQHLGLPVDLRADIYGFCASLYEALYEQRPVLADSLELLRAGILREAEAPAGARVPAWLRDLVLRGLRIDPGERWPDMHALLAALASDPRAARRRLLRRLALVASAAVITVLVSLGAEGLRRSWLAARAEALASDHLAAALAELDPGRAELAFETFVADPAHRDTRALGRAWRHRGDRRRDAGDLPAALHAYAQAYVEAREPDDAVVALRAMAAVYQTTWQSAALGRVVLGLAELRAPGLGDLAVDAALRRRDLPAALAELDADPSAALAAERPLLAALASARPLPVRSPQVVALPPGGPYVAALLHEDQRAVDLLDRNLAPLRTIRSDEPVFLSQSGGFGFSRAGGEIRVLDLLDAGRILVRFPGQRDAYPKRALDLRGDGRLDVFFLFQSPELGFKVVEDARDAPRVRTAHAETERSASDLGMILGADLDGDGVQEIVASFLGWRAYDLRVFHVDEGGELQLVWRAQVGRVTALGVLRRPNGERVLVAAKDAAPNPAVFPDPPHDGAAAGVYLLRWTGRELVTVAHADPELLRRSRDIARLAIGDFDGDGVEEVALGAAASEGEHMLLVRQTDAGLRGAVVGYLAPVLALEVDGDPGLELVADDPRTHELWLLGAGEAPLPPRDPPAMAPDPPPAWLTDEVLTRRWSRADLLDQVGLPASAAGALRDAAALAVEPAVRDRLLDRAADRFALADDTEAALALGERLEHDPELGPRALRRRIEVLGRLGRHAEAAQAAATLFAHPWRSFALGEFADAALTRLGPLLDPAQSVYLGFDRPLAPQWQIDRPAALRRDAIGDVLRVDAVASLGRIAALPLRWSGGAVQVEVELEVQRAEWYTRLRLDLVDAEGRPWLGVGVGGGGARHELHHNGMCRQQASERAFGNFAITRAATRHKVHLSATYFPDRGVVECNASGEGLGVIRTEIAVLDRPAPGPAALVITGAGPGTADHRIALDLARISVRGAALAGGPEPDAAAAAALKLVEGAPAETLRLLHPVPREVAPRALLELLARDELQDPVLPGWLEGAALAELSDADRILLLRTRPRLAVRLREHLGAAFLPLLARAWVEVGDKHADDAELERELVEALQVVDAFLLASTELDAPQRVALAELLLARAAVMERRGELGRALGDDEAALAVLGDPSEDLGASPRARLHGALARLLAELDPSAALLHAERAVASAEAPELVVDRLAREPQLVALAARDPAWQRLLAPALATQGALRPRLAGVDARDPR